MQTHYVLLIIASCVVDITRQFFFPPTIHAKMFVDLYLDVILDAVQYLFRE